MYNVIDVFYILRRYRQRSLEQNKYDMICYEDMK
jgi:hypothetical protein